MSERVPLVDGLVDVSVSGELFVYSDVGPDSLCASMMIVSLARERGLGVAGACFFGSVCRHNFWGGLVVGGLMCKDRVHLHDAGNRFGRCFWLVNGQEQF